MMSCPHEDRERLAADYLARRLSAEQAEAFEEHYFACDPCFEQVELAAGLHAALVRRPGRTAARTAPRVWAWAAAAMLAVTATGVWLLRLPDAGPDREVSLRGEEGSLALSGSRDGAGFLLRWAAVEGAEGYEARVFDVEGVLLWQRRTQATNATVAPADLPAGAAAGPLQARVAALDGLGRPLARSPIVRLPAAEP
jgi:hypothetical protein